MLRADGTWEGRARLRHAETGESIPVSVRSFLITRPADDEPLALATVLHDLRERERAEQAIAVRIRSNERPRAWATRRSPCRWPS